MNILPTRAGRRFRETRFLETRFRETMRRTSARRFARLAIPGLTTLGLVILLAGCGQSAVQWQLKDVAGVVDDLDFQLTRASDEQVVTEDASAGRIRILFFGYTHCPDICPTTLAKFAAAMNQLGDQADEVQVLFVSVDPNRDTPKRIAQYVHAFNPGFNGLTTSESRLRDLVKRYNVTFSYGDGYPDDAYVVTHSSAFFVFDGDGDARLLGTTSTSIDALASDLKQLIDLG